MKLAFQKIATGDYTDGCSRMQLISQSKGGKTVKARLLMAVGELRCCGITTVSESD
jgi:hypothetical protein